MVPVWQVNSSRPMAILEGSFGRRVGHHRESAPVIREAEATVRQSPAELVFSDQIKVKITQSRRDLDRMIALVEGAERQKTPNEIALNILLAG